MIGRAHHVGINVHALEPALWFYRDALGLVEVGRWVAPTGQGLLDGVDSSDGGDATKTAGSIAYLAAADKFLELVAHTYAPFASTAVIAPVNAVGRSHVAFRVSNVRSLYQELSTDVTFLSRPVMASSGGLFVKCLDPSGNVVELCEPPDAPGRVRGRVCALDHYGVNVRYLDRAISFYQHVLGHRVTKRYVPAQSVDAYVSGLPVAEAVDAIAFLDAGDCDIELLSYPFADSLAVDEFEVGRFHLGLAVDDVFRTVALLSDAVAFLGAPQTSPVGDTTAKFQGHEGSTFELISPGRWLTVDDFAHDPSPMPRVSTD